MAVGRGGTGTSSGSTGGLASREMLSTLSEVESGGSGKREELLRRKRLDKDRGCRWES